MCVCVQAEVEQPTMPHPHSPHAWLQSKRTPPPLSPPLTLATFLPSFFWQWSTIISAPMSLGTESAVQGEWGGGFSSRIWQ